MPTVRLGPHFEMHLVVFPLAAAVLLALVSVCFVVPQASLLERITTIRDGIGQSMGWFYVFSMTGFLLFSFFLAFGPYRHIRLGADDERPEFSRFSWFAMLFSAGMGIGLIFYSVAEPVDHFASPPPGYSLGAGPRRLSMATTIFHWGLHPWGLYAIVGLCLAYFGFRKRLPLSFRSVLEPVLGSRVWGRTGDLIDLIAILATLMGVATSLGIGVQQVNAGLSFLFEWPNSLAMQIGLIAIITSVATLSVVAGLDAGIRRLSELNLRIALALLASVVIAGGAVAFLASCLANVGSYLALLPQASLAIGWGDVTSRDWVNGWTVFYWAWWIAWSPFVGLFIARVSKGRTIQEYVLGVLFAPTLISIIWFTAFGDCTLRQHQQHVEDPAIPLPTYPVADYDSDGELVTDADGLIQSQQRPLSVVEYRQSSVVAADGRSLVKSLPTVLFVLLNELMPSKAWVGMGSLLAMLCIVLFFVTSSDSASMVIDIIASGGNPDPPVGTRLFWAITEGLVAAALLYAGGLRALQAASITAALPFTVILLMCCWSLWRSLRLERLG